MSKYTVTIGGSSWSRGPELDADTLPQARKMIRDYGNTADYGTITRNSDGMDVEQWRRDTNGNGRRWFKAEGR